MTSKYTQELYHVIRVFFFVRIDVRWRDNIIPYEFLAAARGNKRPIASNDADLFSYKIYYITIMTEIQMM